MILDLCASIGLDDIEIHVAHPELFADMPVDDRRPCRRGHISNAQGFQKKVANHWSRTFLIYLHFSICLRPNALRMCL